MTGESGRAGRLLRDHVPVEAPPDDAERRADLVRAVARDEKRIRQRRSLLIASGAGLAVAASVVIAARWHAGPSFNVGVDSRGEIGVYYAPAGGADLALSFWDGSAVTVAPHAGVRVAKLEPTGAAVSVETGRVHVHVEHRPQTHWQLAAGPYTINVTGTSFWVSWTPDEGMLDVQMESGSVLVRGPGLESGVTVDSGRHFVTHTRSELSSAEPAPVPSASVASPLASEAASAAPRGAAPTATAEPEKWSVLASHGDYRKIVEDADARGMDAALSSASLDDLGALCDALRYTGHAAQAQRGLSVMRSRFPGSARAKSAAFLLGRMADDGGNPSGALGWYDTYLSESPGGSLAAEALGRRMLVLERLGRSAEAKSAAETYLQRFPTGPYAARAEELAQQ